MFVFNPNRRAPPIPPADEARAHLGGAHVLVFSLFGCAAELVTSVNLAEWQIRQLCLVTREIFLEQPMLLELEAPVNIVGDIHGQYEDLLRHFDKLGYPPDANYLFLGDYVDRGKNSLETICLLLAYKIKYPNNFFLLRGNHECASINRVYGFYDECKRRYSVKLWKTFTDLFNCLPVSALIEGTIFCMHGGLSPQLGELNDIRSIPRPIDVPDSGLVCDLLWGDPAEIAASYKKVDLCQDKEKKYPALMVNLRNASLFFSQEKKLFILFRLTQFLMNFKKIE
uniref:Serine/threonine-protein phosphatase n=1 Tax=Timema monikensis TaxID=170555 RepID=A0A7R9E2D2_9NEOP|nr:unnamed protein product [Timema monikensis]